MPTLLLSQAQRARVDWCDYGELSQHKWYAWWKRSTKSFYAVRNVMLPDGRRVTERLHRRVMGLQRGDIRQVDHPNHDTLDNRRSNLRIVSNRQNGANRRDQSKYGAGVKKMWNRFVARAHVEIGMFCTPMEARAAREVFLKELAEKENE